MTFDARAWAHCLLEEAFFRCLHPSHNKDCGQVTAAIQRAFNAGLERAEEIARDRSREGSRKKAMLSLANAIRAERARVAGEREAGR